MDGVLDDTIPDQIEEATPESVREVASVRMRELNR
jgi:hypothetical protein